MLVLRVQLFFFLAPVTYHKGWLEKHPSYMHGPGMAHLPIHTVSRVIRPLHAPPFPRLPKNPAQLEKPALGALSLLLSISKIDASFSQILPSKNIFYFVKTNLSQVTFR